MRLKIVDEIQNIFEQSKTWVSLEIEYAKLTLAEKMTMLLSTLIIGFICLLLGMVVLIMLAFCLVELFKAILCPALAYLVVAGIICLLVATIYVLRRPLLLNSLAKMTTKIFFDKAPSHK